MSRSSSMLRVAAIGSSLLLLFSYLLYQVRFHPRTAAQMRPGSSTQPAAAGPAAFRQDLHLALRVPPPTSQPEVPAATRKVLMMSSKVGTFMVNVEPWQRPLTPPAFELAPPNPMLGKP